jgi:hypothetical protein
MTRDEQIESNVAVLGQPYGDWNMGQLFALYCLSYIYSSGHLAVAEFEVPSSPMKDSGRLQNQEMLSKLPAGISATVDANQRGAEGDGIIEWTTPIPGIIETRAGKEQVMITPRRAPLEIGYTDASTTCFHLIRFGHVARWPYGHNVIAVLASYPEDATLKWHFNSPEDPILSDFAEFGERLALTRFAPSIGWGIHERRPSAQPAGAHPGK